jgi:hypothetical protein
MSRCIARATPVVSVVRVYSADAPPPARYALAVVVHGLLGWALVEALSAATVTPAQAIAIRRCLAACGYHTAFWLRRDPQTGAIRYRGGATGLAQDDARVIRA